MSFEFVTFRPPEVIGQADPGMLSAVQAAFPEQDTGTEWYRDSERVDNPRLQELLQPLNAQLLSRFVGTTGKPPYAIHYSVDTRTVEPGDSQRGHTWHIDTGDNLAVVLASRLPTDMLVHDTTVPISPLARLGRRYALERVRQHSSYMLALRDEDVHQHALTVHQPADLAMVVMRRHVHRSPKNDTGTPIPRVWIRAAIHRAARGLNV